MKKDLKKYSKITGLVTGLLLFFLIVISLIVLNYFGQINNATTQKDMHINGWFILKPLNLSMWIHDWHSILKFNPRKIAPPEQFCGDFVCEEKEDWQSCPIDCDPSAEKTPELALHSYSNDKVLVHCACSDWNFESQNHLDYIFLPPCQGTNNEPCFNKNNFCYQEEKGLFKPFAELQTQVHKCLETYFGFNPGKVFYLVIEHPVFKNETNSCMEKDGCTRNDGAKGVSGQWGTYMSMFPNGYVAYGDSYPKAKDLYYELHETTHVFLNRYIHLIPRWFNEALAIQTEERVPCTNLEFEHINPYGDSYLNEALKDKPTNGVILDNGHKLNEDFYKLWRNGKATLSKANSTDPYIIGVMWLLGLKLDFNATAPEIGKIVHNMYLEEVKNCKKKETCHVNQGKGRWSNSDILEITKKVVCEEDSNCRQKLQELANRLNIANNPICGNGILEVGEQCETNSDCANYNTKFCVDCICSGSPD